MLKVMPLLIYFVYLNQKLLSCFFHDKTKDAWLLMQSQVKVKATSGVIFACDAEMKVPMAGMSMLFMESRYLAV